MILGAIILALSLALVLAMQGRKGHPKLHEFYGWAYAHRGLHGEGVPENSMEAFRLAKEKGFGAELDVHLLADGSLAVIHDSILKRTTGLDGVVEDLTQDQLIDCYLEGTQQTVPLLADVLMLFDGQAPLIIELKSQVDNYAQLCEKTCQLLDGYTGLYCLESFDPRCIIWLKKHRQDIIRGQLAENYFKTENCKVPFILKCLLANHLMNFLSKPDFIAYRYSDRKRMVNRICRKLWGLTGVTWTVKSKRVFDAVKEEGWIPIFEGFEP
mgnify:CR=1 FL=1